MLPHAKKEAKVEKKGIREDVEELCESNTCSNVLFFESKKRKDLYLWLARRDGPSVKFMVESIQTSQELKMTGNNLKFSRPLLSFDKAFEAEAEGNLHLRLMKEMFTQTFSTPQFHPKSKPFIDHIFSFKYFKGRVWFRSYQILNEED